MLWSGIRIAWCSSRRICRHLADGRLCLL